MLALSFAAQSQFDVWLQADGELSFLYKMSGEGAVERSNKTRTPGSGTYESHEMPADIFSGAPVPLPAKFDFRRDVPESETKAPEGATH